MGTEEQGGAPERALVPDALAEGSTRVVRSGGRARWALAFVVAVAALVGLVVVIGGGSDDDGDAEAALAAAQAVVAVSDSYVFEVLRSDRVVIGDPDGAGSDTTTRSVTRGEIAAPDRWHVVEQPGDESYGPPGLEVTRIGDERFTRWGDQMPAPSGVVLPVWTALPVTDPPTAEDLAFEYETIGTDVCYGPSDEEIPCEPDPQWEAQQKVGLAVMSYLLPVSIDPHHVERVVAEASDPVVEQRRSDGGLRLRARLAPIPELVEVADEPPPPVDLLVDLDADRRPILARFTAALDGVSSEVDVRFRDWGGPVSVSPPPEAEVDRTPWVDEELLALAPELLVAPATLPDGFSLTAAKSGPVFDEVSCRSVSLEYSAAEELALADGEDFDPGDYEAVYEAVDHLFIEVAQADCDDGFAMGGYFGSDEGSSREVRFGDAIVTIFTSLDEATASAIEQSLRLFTLEELVGSIPEGGNGLWFGYAPGPYGYGFGW